MQCLFGCLNNTGRWTHLWSLWEPLSLGDGPGPRAANGKAHGGQLDVLIRILPGHIRCEVQSRSTQWGQAIKLLLRAFMEGLKLDL